MGGSKMKASGWIWAILAGAMIAGCGDKHPQEGTTGTASGSGEKKLRIAVIPKGTTHEFWKAVRTGAEEAGKEFNVEIIWKGPLKEDDLNDQIKVVEDFTTQGVDGIVLAPLNDTAMKTPVENAKKSDIPVVIFDSDLKDTEVVSFVATDNEKGGKAAGEEMIRLLGGNGNVVVLRYQEGSASTMNREKGFLDVMKASTGIKILSDNRYAGATVESAQTEAENLLSGFKKPDGSLNVEGIYCPNESSTFGMLRALQTNGWAGKVKFVGFDSSVKLIEGLSKGEINALILQNPRKMGYLGVKTMVEHLKKTPVEKRVDTGAELVTGDNMKDPAIAKLLEVPK
ncbi:MAG: substrate-binding domain-containing protein [Chlorobia bacterium]|nr:substrate-binding domain-containing protein [Fimbriimonadaceae bacterium]